MGDSYRPNHRPPADASRRPPPRPPPPPGTDNAPRTLGPPPMYRFSGGNDSYRPPYQDRPSQAQDSFSFRSDIQGPQFPAGDSYRPEPPRGPRRQVQGYSVRGRGRPRASRGPQPAHTRAILDTRREITPEQFLGAVDGNSRFLDVDNITDDESENMSLDSDVEPREADQVNVDEDGSSRKRARVGGADADGDAVPKWSNPDPYTSLPPPDESQTKKKDVVKLIRKAKVAAEKAAAQVNAVTENADFISFNFGDDEQDDSSQRADSPDSLHDRADVVTSTANLLTEPPERVPLPPQHAAASTSEPQGWSGPPADLRSNKDPPLGPAEIPQAYGKRKRTTVITGEIISDWLPRSGYTPTPWCVIDHSATEHLGVWLHKEICDFYEYCRPQRFEWDIRKSLISRVSEVTTRQFPGSKLECFGSFASGLFLPTSDMDLVLTSDSYRSRGIKELALSQKQMQRFAALLRSMKVADPSSVEVIAKAKVPLVKFQDRATGIKVDISFENLTGVVANETFQKWKAQFPAMPVLVTLVKQFLAMRHLNEVFMGGIGGFTITCLVTSLLQHLPAAHIGGKTGEHNLGDLFLHFLDLYGNKFNRSTTSISMNPPGYFQKYPDMRDRICIIDPNNPSNDISGGSNKIDLVMKTFADAHRTLHHRMSELHYKTPDQRRGASILEPLYAGNYSTFERQRQRLKQLSDQGPSAFAEFQCTQPNPAEYIPLGSPEVTNRQKRTPLPAKPESERTRRYKERAMKKVGEALGTDSRSMLEQHGPRESNRFGRYLAREMKKRAINRRNGVPQNSEQFVKDHPWMADCVPPKMNRTEVAYYTLMAKRAPNAPKKDAPS